MQIQMMYELNSTYMIISGNEIDNNQNYRYKMLSVNRIQGLLPLEERIIDGERTIFINVTGKESFFNLFNSREASLEEVKELFDSIYIISEEMKRYLISETDIIVTPEFIFKDIATGKYEFVCIPLLEDINANNPGMKNLMHFLLGHIDNNDDQLVTAIYQMDEMYERGKIQFLKCYEIFTEKVMVREVEPPKEETNEEKKGKQYKWYRPGIKEMLASVLVISGAALIGINIYLSMA